MRSGVFGGRRLLPATRPPWSTARAVTRPYPSEADRRRYIDTIIQRGRPTFGHLALAALMVRDRVRVVWTTNFDRNVEDAAAKLFQTTARLGVATLDTPQIEAANKGVAWMAALG